MDFISRLEESKPTSIEGTMRQFCKMSVSIKEGGFTLPRRRSLKMGSPVICAPQLNFTAEKKDTATQLWS